MSNKQVPAGWQPGQSGNPKGRPVGSGEVAKIRATIANRIPEIVDSLVQRALDGDTAAARLLLERAIAPLKAIEQTQPIALPNDGLAAQGRAVVASVSAGELAPSQGAQLISAIGSLARVVEVDELERRVSEMEKNHANH